jgi:glycosyltransferase involved in cell wall biosynthesis
MKNKLLTIAVPAYNAEKYLDKCLSSFISNINNTVGLVLDRLEIIIINDGSSDKTSEIAGKYTDMYPESFSLINKENDGHGSGINTAVKLASGKYFKTIDADDWILTENLPEFLSRLEKTEADVVLTHFHTVNMLDGSVNEFKTEGTELDKEYSFGKFWEAGKPARSCLCFHGICYKTETYRKSGTVLTEKVFYEDQEYSTVPFKAIRNILPLDLFLYEYLLGNAEQSVSDINQVKRIDHMAKVLFAIYRQYDLNKNMSQETKEYFFYKMAEMLLSYYSIMLIKNRDKKNGRVAAKNMKCLMKQTNRELYKTSLFKYCVCLLLSYLNFTGDTFTAIRHSAVYNFLRKLMH